MKRALLAILLIPSAGFGCYNDRDTLGYELRNKPDLQRALTGRFERNPPLYYQMRVDRLRAQPHLTALEDDDLAVALDRLGKGDEALKVLKLDGRTSPDERYRYFANRGTIEAHRWLRRGGKVGEIQQLSAAENDIVRALKINPNAHFGREATQLELLRWFKQVKTTKGSLADEQSLGSWLEGRVTGVDPMRGLAGIILLGGAWESSDVAAAIAQLHDIRDGNSIALLALERYRELVRDGHAPFGGKLTESSVRDVEEEIAHVQGPIGEKPIAKQFIELRNEAEAWEKSRNDFMAARFAVGRHPDTDPHFWDGWKETPMPRLSPETWDTPVQRSIRLFSIGVVVVLIGLVVGGWFAARWVLKRLDQIHSTV